MQASVQLRSGDMFDGPSDLVVLPCSTAPTVTSFVRRRLEQFDIGVPAEPMELGDVLFRRFDGAPQIASWAAFAASVHEQASDPDAIERIGATLGRYAKGNPAVQAIAAPLLGTGAGGLPLQEAAERFTKGFLGEAPAGATLRLHALEDEDFRALSRFFEAGTGAEDYRTELAPGPLVAPPRVFLSYTASSEEHRAWVIDLGTYLRANGVNARLDHWHLEVGQDVAQWMCNELDQADRVLLICDERYAQKADGRHGGVGWEIRIVQGDLLTRADGATTARYVPVICTEDLLKGTPAFLKSVYCIHWPSRGGIDESARREELLRTLFDVRPTAPQIGAPPLFILNARRAD